MFELAIKKTSLFTFSMGVYVAFLIIATIIPPLHYLKYALPFIAFIIVSLSDRSARHYSKEFPDIVSYYLKLYSGLILFSGIVMLLRIEVHRRYLEEAYFILSPIFLLMILAKYYRQDQRQLYIRILFWGVVSAYIMEIAPVIPQINLNLKDAILTSYMVTESTCSFYFGLFALYYFTGKEYRYFIIASLLAFLAYKRIVLLALFICIPVYLIVNAIKKYDLTKSRTVPLVMVVLNLLFVYVSIKFAFGDYDELIGSLSGISSNAFSMGRQELYADVLAVLNHQHLLGTGIGSVTHYLQTNKSVLANMHSDVLKYYLEFGGTLFAVWLYYLYKISLKSAKMFVTLIYVNIILLTDNVTIYFDFMFLYFLFAGVFYATAESGSGASKAGDSIISPAGMSTLGQYKEI